MRAPFPSTGGRLMNSIAARFRLACLALALGAALALLSDHGRRRRLPSWKPGWPGNGPASAAPFICHAFLRRAFFWHGRRHAPARPADQLRHHLDTRSSPYTFTENVNIDPGVWLTVEPGVEVRLLVTPGCMCMAACGRWASLLYRSPLPLTAPPPPRDSGRACSSRSRIRANGPAAWIMPAFVRRLPGVLAAHLRQHPGRPGRQPFLAPNRPYHGALLPRRRPVGSATSLQVQGGAFAIMPPTASTACTKPGHLWTSLSHNTLSGRGRHPGGPEAASPSPARPSQPTSNTAWR